MTNTIKCAEPEDATVITSFAYNAYKDIGFQRSKPVFEKILLKITESIIEDLVLVCKEGDAIKGVVILDVQTTWWSNEPILSNLLMYVDKPYRGTRVIKDLLNAVKEYGIMSNMDVYIDVFGSNFDRKGKLLKRIGFEPIGQAYYYDSQKEI